MDMHNWLGNVTGWKNSDLVFLFQAVFFFFFLSKQDIWDLKMSAQSHWKVYDTAQEPHSENAWGTQGDLSELWLLGDVGIIL